jgi:hypothetical protein
MNVLRLGGLVLLVCVAGCASTCADDESLGNPFCALGRDIKAIGPAITDTTGLQNDVASVAQDLAESGPRLQHGILQIKDVLFETECTSDDH